MQADVTANDEQDQALLRRFGIFGPPTIAFFSAAGKERTDWRVVGYMPADPFRAQVLGALHPYAER
jgi:thiol:disulfide interchange protein DsbD